MEDRNNCFKRKDCVQITVKDDGIGMSEMELEKLNEKDM